MHIDHFNSLVAPARAKLCELLRQVGPRTYSVPFGDEYIEFALRADDTVELLSSHAGPYSALPKTFPLGLVEFSHLASWAEVAARELSRRAADPAKPVVISLLPYLELSGARHLVLGEQRVVSQMWPQGYIPSIWVVTGNTNVWHAKLILNSSLGPIPAIAEVEFTPHKASIQRARLLNAKTGDVLATYPAVTALAA